MDCHGYALWNFCTNVQLVQLILAPPSRNHSKPIIKLKNAKLRLPTHLLYNKKFSFRVGRGCIEASCQPHTFNTKHSLCQEGRRVPGARMNWTRRTDYSPFKLCSRYNYNIYFSYHRWINLIYRNCNLEKDRKIRYRWRGWTYRASRRRYERISQNSLDSGEKLS